MKKSTRVTFLESCDGVESLFTRGLRLGAVAAGWDASVVFLGDAEGALRPDKDVRSELLTTRPDTVCFLMDAPLHLPRLWEAPSLAGVDKISLWFDDYYRSPKTLAHPETWTAWQNDYGVRVGIWDAYWRCHWKHHTACGAFPVRLAADPQQFSPEAAAWQPAWKDRAAFVGTIPSLKSLEEASDILPRALHRLLDDTTEAMRVSVWPIRPYELARKCQSYLGSKYGMAIDAALSSPEILAFWNHLLWRWGKRIARLRGLAAVAQAAPLAVMSGHGTELYAGEDEIRKALPAAGLVYADTKGIPAKAWKGLFRTGKFHVQIIDPQSVEGGLPFRVFETAASATPLLSDYRKELAEIFPTGSGITLAADETGLSEATARLMSTTDRDLRAQGRQLHKNFPRWAYVGIAVGRHSCVPDSAFPGVLLGGSELDSGAPSDRARSAGRLTVPTARRITDAVAGPVSSSAHRPLVLVVSNDFSPNAAKMSRTVALTLEKIGYHAVVRDTRLNRWGAAAAVEATPERRGAFEIAVAAKWNKLINDYGVDLVLGLDGNWILSAKLFLDPESRVQRIHSLWLGDVAMPKGAMFPLDPREVMNAPKVTHHCCTNAQVAALQALGVGRPNRVDEAKPMDQLLAEVMA